MENEELQMFSDEDSSKLEKMKEDLDLIEKAIRLLDKWKSLIKPLNADMKDTYQQLFERQYPGIKPYRQLWHINWVKEAMDFLSWEMCDQFMRFFDALAAGQDYKGNLAEGYQKSKAMYFDKYVAERYVFKGNRDAFPAETLAMVDAMYEENYQKDLVGMAELSKLREEYVDAVLETLPTYYEDELEALSPDESIHLRFLCYMFYEEYFEESKCLNDYLIKKNMVEFPGVGFYQFRADEWKRYLEKSNQKV